MPGQVNQTKFRKMWLDLQQELMKLSSTSRQVFADQSSHFIQFDQPALVIDAIRQMVSTSRRTIEKPDRMRGQHALVSPTRIRPAHRFIAPDSFHESQAILFDQRIVEAGPAAILPQHHDNPGSPSTGRR